VDLPTLPYDRDTPLLDQVRRENQAAVRVYPYDQIAVIIGRGGHQDLELRTDNIAADNIPLYKRPGGGCSVVLDPGNIIVSLALPLPGIGNIKSSFAAISRWLIDCLAECGVPGVTQQGVSDLVLDDRKIGGSCIYRTRGLLYYSTTLLWQPDHALVDRYLQHPPREPGYRRGRSHAQFMGQLANGDSVELWDTFPTRFKRATDNRLLPL